MTKPEEPVSELKEWWKELLSSRIKKKGTKINEDSLRDLWDIKCTNIQIVGVPE